MKILKYFRGSTFAFAGNTTKNGQSALLISSPVACQRSTGRLLFE